MVESLVGTDDHEPPIETEFVYRSVDHRRTLNRVIAVLLLVRIVACGYLVLSHQDQVDGGIAGDVRRYDQIANAAGTPYKDFQVEYPPATFIFVKIVHGPSLGLSITAIALSQLLCDILIAFVLRWVWSLRAQAAYLILGLPLVIYPFTYARIDLFTALLVIGSLALIRRGRDVSGGIALAVAVLAKIWPFAVAPVMLIERRRKGLFSFVATGALALIVWLAVAGLSGVQQVFSFRDATGWQVESLVGIVWHMRDPGRIKFESGAFRTGVMPVWARPTLTLLSLAFIVAAWLLAARRRRRATDAGSASGDDVVYAAAPLACVLALLIFAPILSPQYMVWMLPFAAILAARDDRVIGGITLAITVLTTISYITVPSAAEGALYGMLPVLFRDLLLVALFVVSLQEVAGLRRAYPDPVDPPKLPPSVRSSASA